MYWYQNNTTQKTCLNPGHITKREVDSSYQQVARSSPQEAIESAKTTECGTERLVESNRKQGVTTGLEGPTLILQQLF